MPDMAGPHYLNFLNQLMAVRSSSGFSHLRREAFHMFYKYTTDITYITESGRKKNKHGFGLALSVRREKFWYFSSILCICGNRERVTEQNSHTATRNADSSSRASWPGFCVHKSQLLALAAASLWPTLLRGCR